MAKEFKFNLTDVTVSGVDTIVSGSKVSVGGTEVGKLSAAQSYLDMGSFGKITAVGADTVDVKIAAGVESGVYGITQGNKAKVRNFDASAVTAGMKIDLGVVTVDGGTVNTGSGDDVISVSGSTATEVNVYGGKGADVFVLTSDTNKAVVQDYSYAEGDVVSVSGLSDYKLTNAGEFFSVGGTNHTTVKAAGADGLYKVKLQDGSNENKTYDVVTAKTGEDVSVTLSQDAGIVDVSGAKSAVVDLGQGNDTITAANTALTLKVGRADGTANKLEQKLDKDDTLALLNGDLGIVDVNANGDLTFGDTIIKSAVNNASQSTFKVSFDDGKTTGVAAAGDVITVDASDQPDFYVGIGSSATVSVGTTPTVDAVIDLSDNSKISGNVNFIDATKVTGNATLKGRADVATTIKTGVVAAGKTQEIYTGTGTDSVSLAASSAGVFKVHLSNAEDNADTVTGFNYAKDILVLDDVAKLAADTFSLDASNKLSLGTSKASVDTAVAAGKDLQIQLSGADKAIKVALAQAASIITADQDTDVVLNVKDTVAAGVSYAGATFGEAFTVDLNDTYKYIGTFVSVNASDAGKAALVLGKDGVDNNVTIDGGSVVWGGANSNDSLTIKRDDVDGGSIVWTGAAGGKDTLGSYDGTKDVIYSYDRATWTNEAIKSDVTFDSAGDVIINSADGSTLKVDNTTRVGENLLLMGTQMEVSKVAIAATGVAAYASDVNVYLSAAANTTVKVNNSAVAEGDSAVIDLSANNLMGAGKTYGDNITNIDAHESAGSFLLVGANVSRSNITGGQTMNVLYGGGNAAQTMTGIDAARDLFWFGSTDGHDIINNFDAKNDVVYLWSTTNIDDVKVSSISDNAATVVFEATGSTLNINGTAGIANTTFMVRDGADGYNYYTYDAENKAFVKKQ